MLKLRMKTGEATGRDIARTVVECGAPMRVTGEILGPEIQEDFLGAPPPAKADADGKVRRRKAVEPVAGLHLAPTDPEIVRQEEKAALLNGLKRLSSDDLDEIFIDLGVLENPGISAYKKLLIDEQDEFLKAVGATRNDYLPTLDSLYDELEPKETIAFLVDRLGYLPRVDLEAVLLQLDGGPVEIMHGFFRALSNTDQEDFLQEAGKIAGYEMRREKP